MLAQILLPDAEQLCLDKFSLKDQTIHFHVSAIKAEVKCPQCGLKSRRIHSRYQRNPADLPCAGYTVVLCWRMRRFFCDSKDCTRVTFAEQLPAVTAPRARRTHRLAECQRRIAFEVGGEVGARVLLALGMGTSPDTLLRLIRDAPEAMIKTSRVLGVDDWALRKGQTYGTILVDLESRRPVDLLPERSAATLANWLQAHPGVEVISRDRGNDYIKGAGDGAPEAVQVADRWHLLSNLREALQRFLEQNQACLRAAAEEIVHPAADNGTTPPENALHDEPDSTGLAKTKTEQLSVTRQSKRRARYESVVSLHRQGTPLRQIARQLCMNRKTVKKYVYADTFPDYPQRAQRQTILGPYHDHLQQRWDAGCRNGMQLWREIHQQGYSGSRSLVSRWAAQMRRLSKLPVSANSVPPKMLKSCRRVRPWAARRAVWLLLNNEADLSGEELEALERMKRTDPKIMLAHTLAQEFMSLVRDRRPDALLTWLENAVASGIKALKSFVNGLRQDLAAVLAALTLPWSNGQVEGQVNKLKLIKRQIYGRAKFDLLRRRVLGLTATG